MANDKPKAANTFSEFAGKLLDRYFIIYLGGGDLQEMSYMHRVGCTCSGIARSGWPGSHAPQLPRLGVDRATIGAGSVPEAVG